MTIRKRGFSATDEDFSAVYAAVSILLNLEKPKKQHKLFRRLEIAANLPDVASAFPSVLRAKDCLAEALKRWHELNVRGD